MIRGLYRSPNTAYISGFVYFPPPVDEVLEVPFLVDTGASWTSLFATDLLRLGDKIGTLPVERAPIELRGVGGTLQPWTVRGGVAFVHDEGGFTTFTVNLALIPDAAGAGLPALLGMDILSHGTLQIDPSDQKVTFDAPNGQGFHIPPPWA